MPRAKDPVSGTAATMRSGMVTPVAPVKFQDTCESDEGAAPLLSESACVAEGGTGLTLWSKLWSGMPVHDQPLYSLDAPV